MANFWKVASVAFLALFSVGAIAQEQTTGSSTGSSEAAPPATGSAEVSVSPSPATAPTSFNQVIETVVQRERFFVAQMRHFHPLVETYVQNLKGKEEKAVPVSDEYFLGRLQIEHGADDRLFKDQPGFRQAFAAKLTGLFGLKLLPLGFAQMVLLDNDFKAQNYDFGFVRREFLGEVRCLVIDVQPKEKSESGRFIGRIWVEDQGYNIVRFNGTYTSRPHQVPYLHFDSWRLNLRPGVWLPTYIYSEESRGETRGGRELHFKAQTRLWGYDIRRLRGNQEFTQIVVDTPQGVKDQSSVGQDISPVQGQRQWERQAEDNALDRLQNIGLLAAPGDVDKVLRTVVNNLMVTNNIDIQPDVRARVLLTTPLESFTIGHTIVVSRGLLDVLPDEGSLAMVLAHELAHIALGHRLDTDLAFNDRMFFPDENTFERMEFRRSPADEAAADAKAMEMLSKSPYQGKLGSAGLFLKELQANAKTLKNLIRPHFGNRLIGKDMTRMSAVLANSPNLQAEKVDQIAALPLGARIKVDAWSDRAELVKTTAPPLLSPREKMPFEIAPIFPFEKRLTDAESPTETSSVK